MKFCFVCGKSDENLIDGYCEECYNEKFNLVKIPKEVNVVVCSKCGKVKQGFHWDEIKPEEFVRKSIKSLGKDVKIEVKGRKIFVKGILHGSSHMKEEEHEINVKTVKTMCLTCSQKLGGYYETVIQLRGNVADSILKIVDRIINEKSFYRAEAVKGGFDLYVGNKAVANDAAEFLGKQYNFKTSKSYKLFTKKEGRDIYRTKILVHCD